MTKDKRSGGGSGEVQSTKADSPDAPAEVKTAPASGATFPGASASGPSASEITGKVDPASGVVYPESTAGGVQFGELEGSPRMTIDPASLPKVDPVTAEINGASDEAESAPVEAKNVLKRFRVTFNPPSPVGDRAKLFDCEAVDASDALSQWRAYTGFAGDLAVQPIITEVVE